MKKFVWYVFLLLIVALLSWFYVSIIPLAVKNISEGIDTMSTMTTIEVLIQSVLFVFLAFISIIPLIVVVMVLKYSYPHKEPELSVEDKAELEKKIIEDYNRTEFFQ